jgi:hypothetical protein
LQRFVLDIQEFCYLALLHFRTNPFVRKSEFNDLREREFDMPNEERETSKGTVQLAQQPRPGTLRQFRRSKTAKAVVAPPPETAGQRRPARVRQHRTVKQFRTISPATEDTSIAVVKLQIARRMQTRQLCVVRSHTLSISGDIRVVKAEVARVSQAHQRATLKSPQQLAVT